MKCSVCGKDITMAGSPVCKICDPSMDDIIDRKVESKTPILCDGCFQEHRKTHIGEDPTLMTPEFLNQLAKRVTDGKLTDNDFDVLSYLVDQYRERVTRED